MFAATPAEHVQDTDLWKIFESLFHFKVEIQLPKVFGLQLTKFMVLELFAAGLILLIYHPTGAEDSAGRAAARLEVERLRIVSDVYSQRDRETEPRRARRRPLYVPFLWTLFLFILF